MKEHAREIVLEKIAEFLSEFKYEAGMELEKCKDTFFGYSRKPEDSKIADLSDNYME